MSTMPSQIIKPGTVDEFLANLTFSPVKTSTYNSGKSIAVSYTLPGGSQCRMLMQTPRMRLPFGISKYEGEGAAKFSLQLEFVTDSLFHCLMRALDKKALAVVVANQKACLGSVGKSVDIIKDRQYPIVKESQNGWCGSDPSTLPTLYMFTLAPSPTLRQLVTRRPDSFRGKLDVRHNTWNGICVDAQRCPFDWKEIKGGEGVCLIELGPLWFVGGNWGVKVTIQQIKFWPQQSMTELAIEDEPELMQGEIATHGLDLQFDE
jgi:hypothetical protein